MLATGPAITASAGLASILLDTWAFVVDLVSMDPAILQIVQSSLADVGWGDVVHSLQGAIEDRRHSVFLGWIIGLAIVAWINLKLAQWLARRLQSRR